MQSDAIIQQPPTQMKELFNNDDVLRCIEYVRLKETGSVVTMQLVANHFEITVETLYSWVHKWKKSGLLAQARQLMMMPTTEEIYAVELEVLREWPAIVRHQINTAKSSGSDLVSLQAAIWLKAEIVDKLTKERDEGDLSETLYIESLDIAGTLNPLE